MRHLLFAVALILNSSFSVLHSQNVIDLSGAWQFQTDHEDVGVEQQWHSRMLSDNILLPGSMTEYDKGNPVDMKTQWVGSLYDSSFYFNPYMEPYRRQGNVKFPFFLTPGNHYVGAAWYRRQIYIPRDWADRIVTLFLERPHIETTVFVNGNEVGHQTSLSVPHKFDITPFVQAGKSNTIAIRVYNGIENVGVGQDSHSVTDQTQGDWNGIVGRMELQSSIRGISVSSCRVFPDVKGRKVRVDLTFNDYLRPMQEAPMVTLGIQSHKSDILLVANGRRYNGKKMTFHLSLGDDMCLWDEFHPNLYRLVVNAGGNVYETDFGMREITTRGRQIILNGEPIWLRGTVENCCFPLTGYPPTDEAEWERIFRQCKAYGLNFVRFHSYCPPEAAFAAADRLGLYLQPEGPTWPNHGVKLGAGMKIDKYLMDETERILDTYGNHPSFVMMASGNEPAGNWVPYTNRWVTHWAEQDPRRIYCGASVGGGWAWDDQSQYHVKGGGRGLDWSRHAPSSDDNYLQDILRPRNYKGEEDNNSPIIAHEQGQWCVFPDLNETSQYTGVYKARNFEIFSYLLRDNGMESQAKKFLMASGHLQTLCYKYEIERNLRTPDYAGFQLLGLNDYSGQGTALEGVLNVFWREKGYCDARQWREFCSPVVPLARFPKFVFSSNDTLRVPVEVYNAHTRLSNQLPQFSITDKQQNIVHSGEFTRRDIPVGKNTELGTIVLPLSRFQQPVQLTLSVSAGSEGHNTWNFWVYPSRLDMPTANGIYITDSLDVKALSTLSKGGKVLITAAGRVTLGKDIVQHYLPVFWNTSWFKMRPPHTTGAHIETSHPLFRHFLSDTWGNLNWWELLNRAQVMYMSQLPKDYQSPVQPIDTWHLSRKLGMILECKVGKGQLFMTTMDITRDLSRRLVARQMRYAILRYMQSNDFRPTMSLTPEQVKAFFVQKTPSVDMHTNDSPDELKPKLN